MHFAVAHGSQQCVIDLLKYGADFNACNSKGETPENVATRSGQVKCYKAIRSCKQRLEENTKVAKTLSDSKLKLNDQKQLKL